MRFWLTCTPASLWKNFNVFDSNAGVTSALSRLSSLVYLTPLLMTSYALVWPRLGRCIVTQVLPRLTSVRGKAALYAKAELGSCMQASPTLLPFSWCKTEPGFGFAEDQGSLARAWRHLPRHLSRSVRGWYHRRRRLAHVGRGAVRIRQRATPGVASLLGLTFEPTIAGFHRSTLLQLRGVSLLTARSVAFANVYYLDRAFFFPRLLPRLGLRAVRPKRWKKRRPLRYHVAKTNVNASLGSTVIRGPARGRGGRQARQVGWRKLTVGLTRPNLRLTTGWRALGRHVLRTFRRRRRRTPLSKRLRSSRSVKRTRVWRLFFSANRQRRVWWRSKRRQLPLAQHRVKLLKTYAKRLRRQRAYSRGLVGSQFKAPSLVYMRGRKPEALVPLRRSLRLRSPHLLLRQTMQRRPRHLLALNKAPKRFGRLHWVSRRRSRPYFWRSLAKTQLGVALAHLHPRLGPAVVSAPGSSLPYFFKKNTGMGLKSQAYFQRGSRYQQTDIRLADFIKKFRQPQVKYRPGLSRYWRHHRRSFNIFFWTPWGRPQKRLTAYLARLRHVAGFSYLRAAQLTAVQVAWRSLLLGQLTYSQAWAYVKSGFITINGTRCWNPLWQLYTADVLSFNYTSAWKLQSGAGSFHTRFWQGWRQWGATVQLNQDLSGMFEVDELTLTVGVLTEAAVCPIAQGIGSGVVPFTTLKCYNWKYIT